MNKRNKLRNSASALFLVLAPFVLVNDAWASATIQTKAIALKVIPAPTTAPINRNCLACHTVGQATADVKNLKPGYQAAYKLNTSTLANLKTLLNVLPTTTVGLANSGLAKTDSYEVICAPGGVSLSSSVKDLPVVKLPVVSTQVTKSTALSLLSKDPIDGDAAYSVPTKLVGGAGAVYSVKINKAAYTGTLATHKGAETYTAQLACRNAANALTGLAWRITQNQ